MKDERVQQSRCYANGSPCETLPDDIRRQGA